MIEQILFIAALTISFAVICTLSFLLMRRNKFCGTIVIEPSEDGERDTVRFCLNMDFDELKTHKQVYLNVENRLSQN